MTLLSDMLAQLPDNTSGAIGAGNLRSIVTSLYNNNTVFNVQNYGALGDGVTDDTVAINAAITASTFGSIVFFPQGTYIVSSTIKLLKGRTYRGSGREGTTVRAKAATNLDAVMASETWLSTTPSPTSDNPIAIRDLKIDGNSSAQTSGLGNGLALITFWNTLENLEIVNNRGNGLLLTSKRRDNVEITNTAVECKVIRCAIRSSGAIGIYVEDPTPSAQTVTDGWIVDCVIDTTGQEGIMISTSAGWLVQGNHLYGTARSGIWLDRGGFTRVIGNYVETYGFAATAGTYCGMMCGGDGGGYIGAPGTMVFADNTIIYVDGAAAGSTIRGIRLEASNGVVGRVVLSNNGFYGGTHVAGSHGIRVGNQGATGSLFIKASGNLVSGWDTPVTYVANGGVLSVTGDIFQPGIPTNSTDGFSRLPSSAGPPTGVPADVTSGVPVTYDTTNNKLWVYNNTWVPSPRDLVFNVRDYGATGLSSGNDTTAINNALAAASAAGGGQVFFPPGTYMTDGGHNIPAYVHIMGSEPSGRYWTYDAVNRPPSACAIVLRTGATGAGMFTIAAASTSFSIRSISLLGNMIAGGKYGISFATPTQESAFIAQNVSIVGFTGDGIRGRLFATRWTNVFVGSCKGYGLNIDGATAATDSWFVACIFSGNIMGGVNFESTGFCAEINFTNCRFERSGWNPAAITAPVATNSPGIRIIGNLSGATFNGCSTDANSGNGVEITRAGPGVSMHHIVFTGCRFNRDGFGTMAGGAAGNFAGIKVAGVTGARIGYISFVNCFTTEGKADDAGVQPGYVHPKYGVWWENTDYHTFQGGAISDTHPGGQLFGGTPAWSSNWRPAIAFAAPAGVFQLPSWVTAGRPTVVLPGAMGWNETTLKVEVWNGTAWANVPG